MRDRHQALVIAAALSRASDATAGSSATLFADFIEEHEQWHFTIEESLLLPTLPAGEPGRQLAEHVQADHRYLREAARRFRLPHAQPTVELVHSIGARLRAHVQMEERELFPHLEQSLDGEELKRIGAAPQALT